MKKNNTKQFIRNWLQIIIILGAFAFLMIYFNEFLGLLDKLFSVLRPIIFGSLIALIMNILLVKVEALYFPKSKKFIVQKTRRGVSILISVLLVLAVISLIIGLVVPQLFQSINIIANDLPKAYDKFISWTEASDALPDALRERILASDFDIDSLISQLTSEAKNWIGSVVSLAGRIISEIVDLVFSLMFALYMLANKEKLLDQLKRFAYAYLPRRINVTVSHVLIVANQTFASYFGGQILSALILGVMTAVGMVILRLPFAPVVASVVGVTALIPTIGAYIGNFVGVVLILTDSPVKALIFFIFLIVLQQIEGNLIYPKIVGTRVGLPTYWVLIAVILGGGFGGVFGILIAVPIVATIYYLVKESVEARIRKKPHDGIDKIMEEARKSLYKRDEQSDGQLAESTVDDEAVASTADEAVESAVDEAVESVAEDEPVESVADKNDEDNEEYEMKALKDKEQDL